jgi:tRNA G10  N-methylase Trm11
MTQYLFQFGHSPQLSSRELSQVLTAHGIKFKKEPYAIDITLIQTNSKIPLESIFDQLGGSIRMAKLYRRVTEAELPTAIVSYFKSIPSVPNKIVFSITDSTDKLDVPTVLGETKDLLTKSGFKSRFILPKEGFLAPIQIQTNNVHEFIYLKTESEYLLFHTEKISNFHYWQTIDRDRPEVDPQSGIMPPKVARIMINLGLVKPPNSETFVLDPFCGSGTLLNQALSLNLSCMGSDIDAAAVADTQKNLEWFTENFPTTGTYKVLNIDAQDLELTDLPKPADLIATEVYLGPPKIPAGNELIRLIKDLEQLYQRILPHLKDLLIVRGRLVIALPKFDHPESVKSLQFLIDTCENSGYTLISGPTLYSHGRALVKRAIYILEKKS